jgi:hypothetical protein
LGLGAVLKTPIQEFFYFPIIRKGELESEKKFKQGVKLEVIGQRNLNQHRHSELGFCGGL